MPSRVTPITHRLHSRKFGTRYPRKPRSIGLDLASEIEPETQRFTPAALGYLVYAAGPIADNHTCIVDVSVQEWLRNFNHLLIYRLLKLLYGQPDIVTACVKEDKSDVYPVDWSYSLIVSGDLVCEIRNKYTSNVNFCFWAPTLWGAEHKARAKDSIVEFISAFSEFIDQNLHVWDESSDLPEDNAAKALNNVPAEKYRGAEQLFVIAKKFDKRPTPNKLLPNEPLKLQPVGYLYAAAAIQFFVALESFVTLLYQLLIRPEFQQRTYERLTTRSEIDLRLVSMHVFCSGFAAQPIRPGSDLWNEIIQLRDFRNDLVHGNITDEHHVHSIIEDAFLFFYAPSTDFRGRRLEAKPARAFPRNQTQITKAVVDSVKLTTDAVRNEILLSLDENTRKWVESWLWNPVIHPRPEP
jgi:hypothetical protein